MAGGKLTPRQKMINMMYLVLTALLALNVSNEVLNAFKLVNDGLLGTNISLNNKNEGIYKAFRKQLDLDKAKAEPLYKKAQQAQNASKEFVEYVEKYKKQIIKEAGGIDPESGDIVQRDNIDVATRIFVEANGKNGKELRKKILDSRNLMLSLVDEKDRAAFDKSITLNAEYKKAKGEADKGWEFATFNHVPTTAAVTLLTKFQSDAIASEGAIIEYLIKKIGEADIKFDKLAAKVIAPSSYIMQGNTYKADIFVAAYSSTQNPDVFLGGLTDKFKRDPETGDLMEYKSADENPPLSGAQKIDVLNGFGKYEVSGSGVGERKYSGAVRIKDPLGGYIYYPFEAAYQVAGKAVAVSPTKMNVFYIGVDNPVKITVAGVQPQDVIASMDGGELTKSDAPNYVVRVKTPGTAKITVSAKVDGKTMPMGVEEFRVRRIPDPIPTVGGQKLPTKVPIAKIRSTAGLVALLENFEFEARYNIISYKMMYKPKSDDIVDDVASGPLFSDKMKAFMGRAKPKDIILFDEIKAMGPDGVPRKLGQLFFEII